MKILFHTNQFSLRGTEIAIYDYAHYNETILGNESVIAVKIDGTHDLSTKEKFESRFKVFYYDTLLELNKFAIDNSIDVFYVIKAGFDDGLKLSGVKNCVHAVFKYYEPHGDVYAYVSEWLMSDGGCPFVPHMISLPQLAGNLRESLNIPDNAIVFGRYGGIDTFDIKYVKRAVYEVALDNPQKYFIFMNTYNFIKNKDYFKSKILKLILSWRYNDSLPNVIFMSGTSELGDKVRFIQTCDAMLHARSQGESFGIACGEFSIMNKPVVTCDASNNIYERCHISILQEKGIYYSSYKQIKNILSMFVPDKNINYDAYSENYNPRIIMHKFKKIFLD